MTAPQLQQLEALLTNSDFIPILRMKRPPLTLERFQAAAGWEECIDFIIQMTEVENPETVATGYVEIDKL